MLFNPAHQAEVEGERTGGGIPGAGRRVPDRPRRPARDASAVVAARQAGDAEGTREATAAFVESDQHLGDVRGRARSLVRDVTGDAAYSDVNYVFPTFITPISPSAWSAC